ncbi:hypothetical protein GCM10007380_14160 [Gottfriedia solisilvae]|uniref:Uncharacterized protein n=1 Tax=Gottfriedia solisilvae TaxID=1516104 RepID=A0A8J3AE63_9BACI|nr:hypothetical protein GCM10007380_14160 [Gottfriedia solisilvae]
MFVCKTFIHLFREQGRKIPNAKDKPIIGGSILVNRIYLIR